MPELNRGKFSALIHYVCYRCPDPSRLGSTRLNKILWFADMLHFAEHGTPITGETYVKQQFGPVPKDVLAVIAELQGRGALVVREPEFPLETRQFIAVTKPDLRLFTAAEISLVDTLITDVCENHTARSISAVTHNVIWELAELGEEIPYEAFLATQVGEITSEDVRWLKESAESAA